MKTVVVGASKILIAFLVILMLLGGLLLWWFMFGIRPYDRLNGKIQGLMKTDPDAAMAMFPQLFDTLDKNKMSKEDYGNAYAEYGYFLKEHDHLKEAIEAFHKAADNSEKGWQGITKANAIVTAYECQLTLDEKYRPTPADITALMQAAAIHATRESGDDKWFWPAYDQTLGRMYGRLGEVDKAVPSLDKAFSEYITMQAPWVAATVRVAVLDALIRQGKYSEANKKFIQYCKDTSDPDQMAQVRRGFKDSLLAAQPKSPAGKTEDLGPKVRDMLKAKQYDALDRLENDLLAAKQVWPSGSLYAEDVYRALDMKGSNKFDNDWQAEINSLADWAKAKPNSPTPRIAMGRLLVDYAWKVRGGGYSDSVSEDGWKKFGERLDQAMAALNQVKDKDKTALWYLPAQTCGLGQSWPRPQYDHMVEEGRKRYPDFAGIVFKKTHYLLPRWNGQGGELESYAKSECDKIGGAKGDFLYARTAWYLDNNIDNVMNNTRLSWLRTKSGIKEGLKEYPDSLVLRGVLSVMAMESNDEATAQSAFDAKSK